MTPFVLSYTIQHGLGGHAIPVDYSAMVIMLATEIASQPEAKSGKVPGLERAIPKSKGIEFAGLLHQAAVDSEQEHEGQEGPAVLDAVSKGSSKRLGRMAGQQEGCQETSSQTQGGGKGGRRGRRRGGARKRPRIHPKKKKAAKKTAPVKRPLPPDRARSTQPPAEAKNAASHRQARKPPAKKSAAVEEPTRRQVRRASKSRSRRQ